MGAEGGHGDLVVRTDVLTGNALLILIKGRRGAVGCTSDS